MTALSLDLFSLFVALVALVAVGVVAIDWATLTTLEWAATLFKTSSARDADRGDGHRLAISSTRGTSWRVHRPAAGASPGNAPRPFLAVIRRR